MKKYDRYQLITPQQYHEGYGRYTTIPEGVIGCIVALPNAAYPDPCFECEIDARWYSLRVARKDLSPLKGNPAHRSMMEVVGAIDTCLDHTQRNIRDEVSGVHEALNAMFLELYPKRYLDAEAIRQSFLTLRETTSFFEKMRPLQQFQERSYDAALGHFEFLLRTLESFAKTGTFDRCLCHFGLQHRNADCPWKGPASQEKIEDLLLFTARELCTQEQEQAHPYPFSYAVFLVTEQVSSQLSLQGYGHAYYKKEALVREALRAYQYPEKE